MKFFVKKLKDNAVLPTRAHHDDAGIDLYACDTHTVEPHSTKMIPLGIAVEIEKGYVGLIWDKSSVGSKGLKTLGGVIDAGFRGEVHAVIHNLNDQKYVFEHGHKVAQLLIQKVELLEVVEVKELGDTLRGEGAFGSTGK